MRVMMRSHISICTPDFGSGFFAATVLPQSNFLKIFPLGLLGMESTKHTPPSRCLYPTSRLAMYALTASSESDWQFRTTKAFGASELLCSTPITAASMMCGWVRRIPSSSAGATCQPRTATRSANHSQSKTEGCFTLDEILADDFSIYTEELK